MKIVLLVICLNLCFSCSIKRHSNTDIKKSAETPEVIDKNPSEKEALKTTTNLLDKNISTYDKKDNLDRLKEHKDKLKEISEKKVFSIIHEKVILELSRNHNDFFTSNPHYELLSFSYGNLFNKKGKDAVFIIHDKEEYRILILIYDEKSDKYLQLYKELLVENGLQDCDYGSFVSLDYQIGNELIWEKEYLLKQHESYLQFAPCKIVDISNDPQIILSSGCFAKDFSKTNTSMSLCIPTSSVYNNWECLKFDKTKNLFTIYYGQAFAD